MIRKRGGDMFGKKLKEFRKKAGMTQGGLAEKWGYSQQMVAMIEGGRREPSFDKLIQVAKLFNVSTDNLLGLKEDGSDE